MPRGRKPRTWVRMDCEGILRGSINYLFAEVDTENMKLEEVAALACQGLWMKMIAFAEVCGGRPGFIEDNNEKGLPPIYIAQELHCPLSVLSAVIEIMKTDGAIHVNGTGSIELVNFKHYQFSEYDRQKPYRAISKLQENLDSEHMNLVAERKAEFREKNGRKPTPAEIEKIVSDTGKEIYGDDWRGVQR